MVYKPLVCSGSLFLAIRGYYRMYENPHEVRKQLYFSSASVTELQY